MDASPVECVAMRHAIRAVGECTQTTGETILPELGIGVAAK
jgi:hypothetical protein